MKEEDNSEILESKPVQKACTNCGVNIFTIIATSRDSDSSMESAIVAGQKILDEDEVSDFLLMHND